MKSVIISENNSNSLSKNRKCYTWDTRAHWDVVGQQRVPDRISLQEQPLTSRRAVFGMGVESVSMNAGRCRARMFDGSAPPFIKNAMQCQHLRANNATSLPGKHAVESSSYQIMGVGVIRSTRFDRCMGIAPHIRCSGMFVDRNVAAVRQHL